MSNLSQQSADQRSLPPTISSSRYKPIVPSGTPPALLTKPYSARACDECRRKKVKCISLDNSGYCKTCRRANQPCTFNIKAKKRGPRRGYVAALESRLKRIENLLNTPMDDDNDDNDDDNDEKYRNGTGNENIIVGLAPTHLARYSNKSVDLLEAIRSQHLTKEGRFISGSSIGYILSNKEYSAAISERLGIQIQHNKKSDYYCIVKSGTSEDRRKDQINQLISFGILKLGETINNIDEYIKLIADIDKETSDYLLKIYFAHIHSLLPVINKTTFLEEYREIRASLPSAPILRAVYGAAARYVTTLSQYSDVKFPIPENFSDIMFHKMFRYLNGDYAPDLATVQAIVITNNHYRNTTSWYNGWLMNCVAVRMCQDISLHRSSDGWEIPQEEKETRRNVWWAVYTLDRWFSSSTGKPLTIYEEDCDESYPSEYVSLDNVMDTMTEKDQHLPRFPSIDPEIAEKTTAKEIPMNAPFVQLIKLSEILGRILQGLYTPRAKKYSAEHGSDIIVAYLNKALSDWRANLPEFLEIYPVGKQKIQDHSLTAMSGLICLSYCTSLILLHRPFIEKDSAKKGGQDAVSICTNAAIRIIEVCEEMPLHDFLMVSWDFAIYPVFTASLIHIYNCSNDSYIVSDVAKYNLLRALKVVEKVSSVTPSSDTVNTLLKILVSKASMFNQDPEYKLLYERSTSLSTMERKIKNSSSFGLAKPINEHTPESDNSDSWMSRLHKFDQIPLDIITVNDQTNSNKNSENENENENENGNGNNSNRNAIANSNNDNNNINNSKSFNRNAQYQTGVLTDQIVHPNFNTSTAPEGSLSAEIPVTLPNELFDFSGMSSFSNAPTDPVNDPSSTFRYQPDNPFWAVPNSMLPEDWQNFLLSFPK